MRVLSQTTHITHKPFNNQKQKKNVLSKQVIQRVNGKRERGVGIPETVCVQSEKPVTKIYKEELEDK